MKHTLLYILALTATMLSLASCNNYLDVRPKSEKLESDLFTGEQGFEDAIYGVYGAMTQNSLYGKDLVWGVPEVLAQNLAGGSTAMQTMAKYDYTSNATVRSTLLSIWTKAYETIGYANNILYQLDQWHGQPMRFQRFYKGEMLAVRAMLHFDLVRLFASTNSSATGIPYVTTYNYDVKPFLKVSEVYEHLLTDLHEAETLLADDAKYIKFPHDNTHYFDFENYRETHLNLYAVYALLARVNWTLGNQAEAARYARLIIDSKAFPLVEQSEVQDYLTGVLSPKETIFGLYSTEYASTCSSYLYYYTSYHTYTPYYNGSGTDYLMPYTAVYSQDVLPNEQDYRKEGHFVEHAGYATFRKLVDYYSIENLPSTGRKDLIEGFTLLHASEFYLIAADALLDADYDSALDYYNTEIKSRGLTPLRTDQTLTHQRIANEYRKEMFGEGQTWYNMKRLKQDIVSNAEARTIPASDALYVLPIPEEEFEYRQ